MAADPIESEEDYQARISGLSPKTQAELGIFSTEQDGPVPQNGAARSAKDPVRPQDQNTRPRPARDRRRFDIALPGLEGEGAVARRLRSMLGKDELAGLFRRSGELVHTPRIGEDGYIEPEDGDDFGPAQVRLLNANQLKGLVSARLDVGQYVPSKKQGVKPQWHERILSSNVVVVAYEAARMGEDTPYIRELASVTHTPVLRRDGTVLDRPGYDDETGLLYLPDRGLKIPTIPDRPSSADVRAAVAMVGELVAEFPFVSEDHRANWLGLAFTPIMRPMLTPPYQLGVFTAPNPGSGKSLLAWIIGQLHGRVMRGELPREAEEMRKAISSILLTTTAPVVCFDNVRGKVQSSVLEGLLTTAEWSDRLLGRNEELGGLRNDRLWLLTSNNAAIGGDLGRRVLPVAIDPQRPDPHLRKEFRLDLKRHVPAHRGKLLAVMLTIVRGWVVAGMPTAENVRSDDYREWTAGLGGMLSWAWGQAGVPIGQFGDVDGASVLDDPDQDEWAGFLAAIYDGFGARPFTVKELAEALRAGTYNGQHPDGKTAVDPDALPGELAHKFSQAASGRDQGFKSSLGWWLKNRDGRYAHGTGGAWKVELVGGNAARKEWRVVPPG